MKRILVLLALLLLSCIAQAQQAIPPSASKVLEGSHTFCQSTCKLYSISVASGATAGFVMIFAQNTDPADGSLANNPPAYCWQWPANTGQGFSWPYGVQFPNNGMTMVYSSGANCLTKTESATAFFTVQVQ